LGAQILGHFPQCKHPPSPRAAQAQGRGEGAAATLLIAGGQATTRGAFQQPVTVDLSLPPDETQMGTIFPPERNVKLRCSLISMLWLLWRLAESNSPP